jgi:hypothetical protein
MFTASEHITYGECRAANETVGFTFTHEASPGVTLTLLKEPYG